MKTKKKKQLGKAESGTNGRPARKAETPKPCMALAKRQTGALTPREAYLAGHPEERALQEAALGKISEGFAFIRGELLSAMEKFFKERARDFWELGMQVKTLVERLPGGELTEDFYQQLKPAFVDSNGQAIPRHQLIWLMKMAERRPDGKLTSADLMEAWRQLPLQMGEEEPLRLASEGAGRPPYNPYDFLSAYGASVASEARELTKALESWRQNPQFGSWATLKERRPDLHGQMRPILDKSRDQHIEMAEALGNILLEMGI